MSDYVKELKKKARAINKDLVAKEVLTWLTNNVENFIDNQSRNFKVDLIIDESSESGFSETLKLQKLFKDIPEDVLEGGTVDSPAARQYLHGVVEKIFALMDSQKELKDQLFKRMIYYYEMTGFHNGKPIEKTLVGEIQIVDFVYDAFDVQMTIKPKIYVEDEEGNIIGEKVDEENAVSYKIPEGFSITIEIAFVDQSSKARSLF